MPGLKPNAAGTRLMRACGMLLLVSVAAAEHPADTQRLDELSRDSRNALRSMQGATEPGLPASQAAYQRQELLRLQSRQRNELLRQHYRDKMIGQAKERVRLESIARQRRYQAQQESQLRRFGQSSNRSSVIRPTPGHHRQAPDPLAPLRR
jgi:hypothetical protein